MDVSHERVEFGKEEWLTPKSLIDGLGPFDLDPCSPCRPPWRIAESKFCIHDDGLTRPWHGLVWMNPPYGRKTRIWLAKLADHGTGVALVYARTDTAMIHDHVFARASSVVFLRGRLTFLSVEGAPAKNGAGAPSMLVGYGAVASLRLASFASRGGHFFVEL